MKVACKLVFHFWRLGLVSFTLMLDLALLGVLVWDLIRLSNRGVCPTLPFETFAASPPDAATLAQAVCLFVVLAMFFPVLIGSARLTPLLGRLPQFAARSGLGITLTHGIMCCILALSVVIAVNAGHLAGVEATSGQFSETFKPWYGSISYWAPFAVKYSSKGIALSILGLVPYVLFKFHHRQPVLEFFEAAAELSDLPAALVPVHKSHELDFNMPTLAPSIRLVKDVAERVASHYDMLRPGTPQALDYLTAVTEECKGLISKMIIPADMSRIFSVKLTSGAERAAEIALAHTSPEASVVVSPFEHPEMRDVIAWSCGISRRRMISISFDARQLFLPWDQQERLIVDQVRPLAAENAEIVLLVSEVVYATGRVVPVDKLIAAIRAISPVLRLTVIIDGTHSVGNLGYVRGTERHGGPRHLEVADMYLFAAHKWLMAPEPCGVLLTTCRFPEVDCYDEWGRHYPTATPSPQMIAGLRGALELLQQIGLQGLCRRSQLLQRRFLKYLPEAHLEEVRPESAGGADPERTAICVLKPAAGYTWQLDFRSQMVAKSVGVYMPEEWGPDGWLAVAFPYYLSIWGVDRLRSVLQESVTF